MSLALVLCMMLNGGQSSGSMRISIELRRKTSSIPKKLFAEIFCRIRVSKKLHVTFYEERSLQQISARIYRRIDDNMDALQQSLHPFCILSGRNVMFTMYAPFRLPRCKVFISRLNTIAISLKKWHCICLVV